MESPFSFWQNRRINPNASTGILHAGLSSARIWNRAMDYAVAVYEFVTSLPDEEKYNLASQLRRAVTSAPLNIAEGCGAASNTEFARFLGFAYRSLKEAVSIGTL
jgi:four helix bundle protein